MIVHRAFSDGTKMRWENCLGLIIVFVLQVVFVMKTVLVPEGIITIGIIVICGTIRDIFY